MGVPTLHAQAGVPQGQVPTLCSTTSKASATSSTYRNDRCDVPSPCTGRSSPRLARSANCRVSAFGYSRAPAVGILLAVRPHHFRQMSHACSSAAQFNMQGAHLRDELLWELVWAVHVVATGDDAGQLV